MLIFISSCVNEAGNYKKVGPTSCETQAVAEGGAQRILGKMLKKVEDGVESI